MQRSQALQTPPPIPGIQPKKHSSHTHPTATQGTHPGLVQEIHSGTISGRVRDPEGFLEEGAAKLSWEGWLSACRPLTKSSPAVSPNPHCKPQGAAGVQTGRAQVGGQRGEEAGEVAVACSRSGTCPWAQTRAGRWPGPPSQSWAKGVSARRAGKA